MFIISPADIERHHKVDLEMPSLIRQVNNNLKACAEYQDVFSVDLSDIGKTRLVTMDINTADSPYIS